MDRQQITFDANQRLLTFDIKENQYIGEYTLEVDCGSSDSNILLHLSVHDACSQAEITLGNKGVAIEYLKGSGSFNDIDLDSAILPATEISICNEFVFRVIDQQKYLSVDSSETKLVLDTDFAERQASSFQLITVMVWSQ